MNNIYRADLVAGMSADELNREIAEPDRLVIARTPSTKGVREITTVWAPFDHVNRYARVALVSLTPSRIQMRDALRSYRGSRVLGESHADALERASVAGSYTGNMRRRLVAMLDEVGLHHYLDIASTSDLWSNASGKAHFTSCLRWPVFVGGKSYDGSSPGLLGRSDFRFMVEKILAREIASLPPGCLVIPLGAAPNQVVRYLAQSDPGLDRGRILAGMPHPASPANDLSAQFLGRNLSPTRKTPLDPRIRAAAVSMKERIAELGSPAPTPRILARSSERVLEGESA